MRGEFRINAGTAEKEELGHTVVRSGLDDVVLDCEVLDEKFHGAFGIGHDAADPRGCIHYDVRAFGFKKTTHGCAVEKVEFGAGASEDLREALRFESANDRAPNHAAMSSNEDFRLHVHASGFNRVSFGMGRNASCLWTDAGLQARFHIGKTEAISGGQCDFGNDANAVQHDVRKLAESEPKSKCRSG